MNVDEILKTKTFDKALIDLCADPKGKDKNIDAYRDAYDGKHAILTDPLRATKTVGDTAETRRVVKFTKEVIAYQRRIVNSAVTFLFGKPVTLSLSGDDENEKSAFKKLTALWKQNKLDFFNKALARELFVECKAAELWHAEKKEGKEWRIRTTLLSRKQGYSIYPHYDDTGDMDAFTVKFNTTDSDNRAVENATIYTANQIIRATKRASQDWQQMITQNLIGKIPVIYVEQDKPEWDGVETQIERTEYLHSNFADSNDYFSAPALEVKGRISNLPKKEETGKLFMVEPETNANGDVSYPGGIRFVTWEGSPESTKLEMGELRNIIYSMTQTPDLSFDNVKGLSALSGIAIRLMFSDAEFKAMDKQEIFGPALERRISIMKSFLALANVGEKQAIESLDVNVQFESVVPEDINMLIQALSTARGGEPIMSLPAAVRQNPLVQDAEADIEILESETTAIRSFAESYR